MKRLIDFAQMVLTIGLCIFLLPCFAQVPSALCSAYGYAGNVTISSPPGEIFKCAPHSMPGGMGSYPRWEHNNGGVVAWNYCTNGFNYSFQIAVATDAVLTDPTLYTDWTAAQFAKDTTAALNDFARKHITLPLSDPSMLAIWCPSYGKMMAGIPAPVAYIVKPDPVATYRSTYHATAAMNGTRIAPSTASGKVAIKQPDGTPTACNCMKTRVIEGDAVYCTANDDPLAVTSCTRK